MFEICSSEQSPTWKSSLDFSDIEDAAGYSLEDVRKSIVDIRSRLTEMLSNSAVSERLRDGMRVVIAGAPNVGKSTLFNYLADRDVAIVSPTPGTTRDSLEIAADIAGFPVTFIDTAGIRDTTDDLEGQGIARSVERAKTADLVLWLFDAHGAELPGLDVETPIQRVRTKTDLGADPRERTIPLSPFPRRPVLG